MRVIDPRTLGRSSPTPDSVGGRGMAQPMRPHSARPARLRTLRTTCLDRWPPGTLGRPGTRRTRGLGHGRSAQRDAPCRRSQANAVPTPPAMAAGPPGAVARADPQLIRRPIDVVNGKPTQLAGTQAQLYQQEQDRVVTPPAAVRALQLFSERSTVGRSDPEVASVAAWPPSAHVRHRLRHPTLGEQEPQQRAQSGHQCLRRLHTPRRPHGRSTNVVTYPALSPACQVGLVAGTARNSRSCKASSGGRTTGRGAAAYS
jgi:hypothetical protein